MASNLLEEETLESGSFFHFNKRYRTTSENRFSLSATEQRRVEDLCAEKWSKFRDKLKEDPTEPALLREKHVAYLRKGLNSLPAPYETLDASRPWITYWILQSLAMLKEPLTEECGTRVVAFLKSCEHPDGGYGGGPGQYAHLATTYAAVMALCIVGTVEAFESIDRVKLKQFISRMKQPDGSFCLHDGGEEDIRGAYCAIAAATITNIVTPDLVDKTPEWIISCQTYEGGFGALNGTEAHGGYTFCGLATMVMLGRESLIHLPSLNKWVANKQMSFEGGFQGRTNKLVDGCYTYWQGASFPLIHSIMARHRFSDSKKPLKNQWLFDNRALQNYILVCCQWPDGGLVDKPGKRPDYYHTCYTLSGLSIAQNFLDDETDVVGIEEQNTLAVTHPVLNVPVDSERRARDYFYKLASI